MRSPRFPTVPTGALRLLLEDVAAAVRGVEGSVRWLRVDGADALELRPPKAPRVVRVEFDRDEVRVLVLHGERGDLPAAAPRVLRGVADPADTPRFVSRVRAVLREAYRLARAPLVCDERRVAEVEEEDDPDYPEIRYDR
jgi:hypothetical protein